MNPVVTELARAGHPDRKSPHSPKNRQIHLFEPMTIHSITIPNRLWVAPMCQSSTVDGVPNDWPIGTSFTSADSPRVVQVSS
ncbi:hypothetical protein BKP42_53690 [Rhodococcus erythropolis]|nr:hypothetical protein BKP42_53690 [Rhodococcus erythropolis]